MLARRFFIKVDLEGEAVSEEAAAPSAGPAAAADVGREPSSEPEVRPFSPKEEAEETTVVAQVVHPSSGCPYFALCVNYTGVVDDPADDTGRIGPMVELRAAT